MNTKLSDLRNWLRKTDKWGNLLKQEMNLRTDDDNRLCYFNADTSKVILTCFIDDNATHQETETLGSLLNGTGVCLYLRGKLIYKG